MFFFNKALKILTNGFIQCQTIGYPDGGILQIDRQRMSDRIQLEESPFIRTSVLSGGSNIYSHMHQQK